MEPPARFKPNDDRRIARLVKKYGTRSWQKIAEKMGNRFSVPRLQFRYYNMIRIKAKKDVPWTAEDDKRLANLVLIYGTRWTLFTQNYFPDRAPYFLKNKYRTYTRRKEIEAQNKAAEERMKRLIEEYQEELMRFIFPDSLVQEYYDIYDF